MSKKITYVNSAPASIVLDLNRSEGIQFRLTSAITGTKTLSLSNDGDATGFLLSVDVTTDVAITLPSNFIFESTDARAVSHVLTLTGTGTYLLVAIYDGVNWLCKCTEDGGYV